MNKYNLIPKIICISLAALLGACGTSPPAKLYLLEPVAVGSTDSRAELSTIFVSEVVLAEHLTRKEILSRDHHFQVSAASFDRWAEPLESNITSVIAENLSVLIASDRVISHPWILGEYADFTVSVQVFSFGPDPGGSVVLKTLWRIAGSDGETVALRRVRYSQPRSTNDPLATVAAMSAVLGELSVDIASSLRTAVAISNTQEQVGEEL